MSLKQLVLSLCLECIDIRLGVCSIYTIINNEVVYFEVGGNYRKSTKYSLEEFKTLNRISEISELKSILKEYYGVQ